MSDKDTSICMEEREGQKQDDLLKPETPLTVTDEVTRSEETKVDDEDDEVGESEITNKFSEDGRETEVEADPDDEKNDSENKKKKVKKSKTEGQKNEAYETDDEKECIKNADSLSIATLTDTTSSLSKSKSRKAKAKAGFNRLKATPLIFLFACKICVILPIAIYSCDVILSVNVMELPQRNKNADLLVSMYGDSHPIPSILLNTIDKFTEVKDSSKERMKREVLPPPNEMKRCPFNQVWKECGSECPRTCEFPQLRRCPRICVEGCFCPQNIPFLTFGGHCVEELDLCNNEAYPWATKTINETSAVVKPTSASPSPSNEAVAEPSTTTTKDPILLPETPKPTAAAPAEVEATKEPSNETVITPPTKEEIITMATNNGTKDASSSTGPSFLDWCNSVEEGGVDVRSPEQHCYNDKYFTKKLCRSAIDQGQNWYRESYKTLGRNQQAYFFLYTVFGFILLLLSIGLRANLFIDDEWSSSIVIPVVMYTISTCLTANIFKLQSGNDGMKCFQCSIMAPTPLEIPVCMYSPWSFQYKANGVSWNLVAIVSVALKLWDTVMISLITLKFVLNKSDTCCWIPTKIIGWFIIFPLLIFSPCVGVFRFVVLPVMLDSGNVAFLVTEIIFYIGMVFWAATLIILPIFCKRRMCKKSSPFEDNDSYDAYRTTKLRKPTYESAKA